MWPNSVYARPISSFVSPVPLVGTDPDATPLLYVSFNARYLPYIIGSLKQLLLQSTWQYDTLEELDLQQQRIFDLLYLFSIASETPPGRSTLGVESEMAMIRQNPDNPCQLQTSVDGVTWCTFADFSLCQQFGSQPGITPPPSSGGGTQQTCGVLNANGHYLVPAVVSSGDQITLQASGAGYDGVENDFGPLWRLPNGDQFVGGIDVGFPTNYSTDPIPSANHMTIIAVIGATPVLVALPLNTPVNVPSGISNAQLYLEVNDDDITDNLGSYQICVKIKNNAAAAWHHDFDFTIAPGPFANFTGGGTDTVVWHPGVGWVCPSSSGFNALRIDATIPTTHITRECADFTFTSTRTSGGQFHSQLGSSPWNSLAPGSETDCVDGSYTGTLVEIAGDGTGMSSGGTVTITGAHFEGTGTDPF